jgi:hypothetical protein
MIEALRGNKLILNALALYARGKRAGIKTLQAKAQGQTTTMQASWTRLWVVNKNCRLGLRLGEISQGCNRRKCRVPWLVKRLVIISGVSEASILDYPT